MSDGKDYHLPLVQVRLNDKTTATFIIDSGSDSSLITDTLAKTLGAKAKHIPTEARKMITDQSLKDYLPTTVQIGDFDLPDVPLVIVKPTEFSNLGLSIDGLLGNNFLSAFSVLFDFTKHQITLSGPGGVTSNDLKTMDMVDATVIRISDPQALIQDIMHVQMTNGTQTTEEDLLVDTGGVSTQITQTDAQKLGLTPLGKPHDTAGFNGKESVNSATLPTLQLGTLTIPNVEVDYAVGEASPIPYSGL